MRRGKWEKVGSVYLLLVLDNTGNIRRRAVFNTPDEAWDYFDEYYGGQGFRAQVLDAQHMQDMTF